MESFDFIIVGGKLAWEFTKATQTGDWLHPVGGAAGCLLASRLAQALSHHSFLLIDAGGKNTDVKYKSFGERYWTLMTPGYNWGYKTVPQSQLAGRPIDCSRGKGLGGSTAINFCVYTKGSSADYDHWAELVGDDSWLWENSRNRFSKVWLDLGPCRRQPQTWLTFSRLSGSTILRATTSNSLMFPPLPAVLEGM